MGQELQFGLCFFTKEPISKNNCPKFEKLSHQKLQVNFDQNWFTGVSKCPLLTGNSKLVEFQSHKQKPWVSKLWFCYCLFSGVSTLSSASVL